MDEWYWFRTTEPGAMLGFLGKVSERKAALFAVGCCRGIWQVLSAEGRNAVEVAERYADGLASEKELEEAARQRPLRDPPALDLPSLLYPAGMSWAVVHEVTESALDEAQVAQQRAEQARADYRRRGRRRAGMGGAAMVPWMPEREAVLQSVVEAEKAWEEGLATFRKTEEQYRRAHCALAREVFGNPFRPVSLSPSVRAWNGGTVVRLAQAAYSERCLPEGALDPALLPVLAHALEEAGCTDEEVLGHLRGPGPHMRGCWAVDLVLAKK